MALDTTKTAHELITSGRSTGQTVLDSDGNLKWALHNIAQTDLDNAAEWSLLNLASSVEADVNANGKKKYLLTEDTTTGVSHRLSDLLSVVSGETYTIAAIAESNGRYAAFSVGTAFGNERWTFDLDTLAVVRQAGTSTTSTATATALTGGEVLIEFTATSEITGNVYLDITLWDGGAGDTAYDGDGTSGLYVSEVKVHQSSLGGMQRDKFGSNFLENETGAALYGLGIDYSTGRGGLQVYEGRTNLLLNTASLSTQNVTVTATPHTLSFTGTGTVTLSGASTAGPLVGTGAADTDRVNLTFTPSAGTLTLTVSGSVTFAQLEEGSSLSPYIPTYGSTVTRGSDSLTTLVSSFGYNVNVGTVVVDFVSSGSDGSTTPKAFQFDNGTNNDSTGAGLSTTDNITANVAVGGVSQAALDGGSYMPEVTVKVAFSWAANDFAVSVNGGAVVTDTSGSVPTATTLRLGMDAAGVNLLNGRVASFAYYPFRAPNEQLVEAAS